MKFLIFKRQGEELGRKLGSYEAEEKDDSSRNRPEDQAEPKAIHLELPEGMDENSVIPSWNEELEQWELIEDDTIELANRQKKANDNLDKVRELRSPLLAEADKKVNTLEDDGQSAATWRLYRKALRECTDSYKKINGDAKLTCENLNPLSFEFPTKPE